MSIPFLYLVGRGYNQVARATTPPVPLTDHAILGQISAISDYGTEEPFYFDGTAGGNRIDFDLNQTVNGGFETAFVGSLPGTGWGKSAGATLTRITGSPAAAYEGTYALEVVGADQEAYFDLQVAAGEVRTIAVAALCELDSGGGGVAEISCQNLATGKWMALSTPGVFTWQAARTWWGRSVREQWTPTVGRVTVESYALCHADLVTLRFYFRNVSPAASSQFDAFYCWPRINFACVIGHNVPPGMVLALRSGATSAVLTGRGQFSIAQPTMFLSLDDVDDRFWRLVGGDAPDLREIGMREFILGQARTLIQQREDGAQGELVDPQDRSESELGPQQAFPRTERGRRTLSMDLKHPSDAELAEWREIMERSRNGAYPLLMVPDSTQANSAMLCCAEPVWSHAHLIGSFNTSSCKLVELPFYSTTS